MIIKMVINPSAENYNIPAHN